MATVSQRFSSGASLVAVREALRRVFVSLGLPPILLAIVFTYFAVDQPRFVGHMSLTECKDSSRSFRKLVKELEQRLPPPPYGQEQPPRTEQCSTPVPT